MSGALASAGAERVGSGVAQAWEGDYAGAAGNLGMGVLQVVGGRYGLSLGGEAAGELSATSTKFGANSWRAENNGAFSIKNSGWSSEVGYSGGAFNAEGLTGQLGSGVVGKGVANATPLAYDISNWGKYGLPSDGTFVRTLTPSQYRDLMAGRPIQFGGGAQPEFGYPNGMGFIGSAEEVRGINTVAGYREALKLDYDPKFVMEFQLRDPAGLQNVVKAPWEEFVYGGKTGAGYSEWNYPGITSGDIVNPKIRVLR